MDPKGKYLAELAWHVERRVESVLADPLAGSISENITKTIFVLLTRPGWPGQLLSITQKDLLKADIAKMARPFDFQAGKKDKKLFSMQVASLLLQSCKGFSRLFFDKPKSQKSLHQLLERRIKLGLEQGLPTSLVVKDTMQFAVKTELHKRIKQKELDPKARALRTLFSLPSTLAPIPKQDIRRHLVHLPKASPLTELIKQATPFSEIFLKRIMGEDLYARYTPVGFSDKAHKILLIKVGSSSDAYQGQYLKESLLSKLKQTESFSHLEGIRFWISPL